MNLPQQIGLRLQRALKGVLPISALACLGGAVALLAQSEPKLPEGPGKAQFSRICSECHSVDVVTNMRMSEGGWAGVVDDMVSRGAQASSDDIALVTKYLAANFGPDNAAGAAKTAKVHVNTASEKELVSTLGITDKDAAAIVRYREANGNFADLAALRKVPGLDLKRLEENKDRIDFSADHSQADHSQAGAEKGK
jgi:competence protein ComEA